LVRTLFSTDPLKQRIAEIAPLKQKELAGLVKQYGNEVIGSYTIESAIKGMRGCQVMYQDTSSLDPIQGVKYRCTISP